jgi:choline dehydrogenase-like flavoprotein
MLIDLTEPGQDVPTQTYDVCIIGAGPAGMTLARQLLGTGLRVALLESGGRTAERPAQSLGEGTTIGDYYPPLETTRQRQIGGTAGAWHVGIGGGDAGARYVPFDPIDFERRGWLPHSGWPFDASHLAEHYRAAQRLCGLGPFDYDPQRWSDHTHGPWPFADGQMTTGMFQFGSRNHFTSAWRDDIARSSDQHLICHATAIEIMTVDGGGSVSGVRIARPDGRRETVRARWVVLAGGGIENARLLLLSRGAEGKALGNDHDLVGRYFMDHPLGAVDRLVPFDRGVFDRLALYDLREVEGTAVMAKMQLSEAVIRREGLIGLSAILLPRSRWHWSEAVESARRLARAIVRFRAPRQPLREVASMLRGWPDVCGFTAEKLRLAPPTYTLTCGGWSKLSRKAQRFDSFAVMYQVEQSPDPDNRVVLGEARDAFGCPKAELHWRFTDLDRARMERSKQLFAAAFERAGLGRLERLGGDFFSASTHHHMGTTRMDADPREGVVDADLKVHGVANLSVAGSSVFPTGSYANPTLTIVALSVRLANYLRTRLREPLAGAGSSGTWSRANDALAIG